MYDYVKVMTDKVRLPQLIFVLGFVVIVGLAFLNQRSVPTAVSTPPLIATPTVILSTTIPQQTQPVVNAKPILTYWGPSLDVPTATEWTNYLNIFKKLKDLGFTHVGIHGLWDNRSSNWGTYDSRVQELRNLGFNLALHFSPGRLLTDPNELDPQTHEGNGKNLKYFDSAGFVVGNCAAWGPPFRGKWVPH